MKIYAGIGSRQTPHSVCEVMTAIGEKLAEDSWTLRSGGARGADKAFEAGAILGMGETEIWHPWQADAAAYRTAELYHPAWERCSQGARALHARNSLIILGEDLRTPVDMVVCWTPDARPQGGTAQGMRIAKDYGIHIRNLGDSFVLNRAMKWLGLEQRTTLF